MSGALGALCCYLQYTKMLTDGQRFQSRGVQLGARLTLAGAALETVREHLRLAPWVHHRALAIASA
jgi:hypothetical protein